MKERILPVHEEPRGVKRKKKKTENGEADEPRQIQSMRHQMQEKEKLRDPPKSRDPRERDHNEKVPKDTIDQQKSHKDSNHAAKRSSKGEDAPSIFHHAS